MEKLFKGLVMTVCEWVVDITVKAIHPNYYKHLAYSLAQEMTFSNAVE